MSRSRISFSRQAIFEEPTVNLTPLIDVVFVILIMFIVIAPLLELDQIELAEASNALTSTSIQESSPITIHVHPDNTIWLNHQPIVLQELKEKLKQLKEQFPTKQPQIFHDRRAQFGTYQTIKNTAEEVGFSNLEIILKPI